MNDHELDDELDEALAAAAPVHDRDLRSPATRAAVMAEMEEIVTMQATTERDELHLPNRRTPRVVFAVASVAAAVALVGMLAWAPVDDPDGGPTGSGEVAGTAPQSTESPEATDDLDVQIISATRAALADSIMLQTQVDVSGHVTQMWSDEATGAMRIAMTGSDGGDVMFDHGLADPTDPSIVRQVDHCFAEYTEGERWGPDSRGSPAR
jgi:hypothetical protein